MVPLLAAAAGAVFLWRMYQGLVLPGIPPLPETSVLYDRDGHELMQIHAEFDRTLVDLDRVSEPMQQAIVATEDKTFWEHDGISITGMARAAWVDIRNLSLEQGGSTITQQYVKNVFPTGERTVVKKLEEAMLAMKLEKQLTAELGPEGAKQQILQNYLNTIYFGHGAYGVEAAAQTYFSVSASRLTVLQAATLAGLVAAPSAFDPTEHKEKALERRNYALGRMAEDGYITAEERAKFQEAPLRLNVRKTSYQDFRGDFFTWYARGFLEKAYGEQVVASEGLSVRTTLDLDLQKEAEKAVSNTLDARGDPDAALVAIDVSTGEVLAMVGGKDFSVNQYNLATQAQRQAGSSFKPFILLTAIQAGYSVDDAWYGPQSINIRDERCGKWAPSNAADEEAGTFTLISATAHSVNTVFAQLVVAAGLGPDEVVSTAQKLGIKSPLEAVCSIALGTQGVTPLEMTSAYATLASGGIYHKPTPIIRVQGDVKRTTWVNKQGKQAIKEPNDVYLATEALQAVVEYGTGTGAALDGIPVAGKTGTTQDYKNAWFCGYTTELATCVWMGYRKHELPMTSVQGVSPVFGGTLPADIWHDFMTAASDLGWSGDEFPKADHDGYDRETPFTPDPDPTPVPTDPPSETETPAPEDSPLPEEEVTPSPDEKASRQD